MEPGRAVRIVTIASAFFVVLAVAGCEMLPNSGTESVDPDEATAQQLYEEGSFAESEDAYRELVQEDPDDTEARKDLARTLAAQGNIEGAIDEYHYVIQADPEDVEAYAQVALLERQIGLAEEAAGHLEVAAAAGLDPWLWDELARTYLQLGRAGDAAEAWARLLENAELDDGERKSVLVMQAEAYIEADMSEHGSAAYEAALEVDPSDQNVRQRLAELSGDV
jgi:tetratricopeptide (TPR) repeat protein